MALYSEKVMDHFQHPRNVGKLPDADGVGEVGNAKCGDIMRMYIQVDPETQVITDVKFNTFGCGSAIATSSMATEMIKGKPVSEALQLTNRAVVEALDGLPAHKLHCSVLAEEAVRAAIRDYYDRNSIPYGDELRAWCWLGPWCLEKTEHVETEVFPFGQEGIDQARAWLEEKFNAVSRDTIEAKSAFLDSEPWTPPAPEEEKDEDAPPY